LPLLFFFKKRGGSWREQIKRGGGRGEGVRKKSRSPPYVLGVDYITLNLLSLLNFSKLIKFPLKYF
jgi:hypothetical protein